MITMKINSDAVMAASLSRFLEISRAACVHVFKGCQCCVIASANVANSFSISGMDSAGFWVVITLIFTCFCCVVEFTVNAVVSNQYRTALILSDVWY